MGCATQAPGANLEAVLYDLLRGSRYNRELGQLVRVLERVRERLMAFVDVDPAAEMVAGLGARGIGPATAAVEVTEYLHGADDPEVAREAVLALVWVLDSAAGTLRGCRF